MRKLLLALATAIAVAGGCTRKDGGVDLPGGGAADLPREDEGPAPQLMEGWGRASPLGGGGVLTYAFTVADIDLKQMTLFALREQWVPAELTVSGQVVGPVGLRWKGSAPTLEACFQGGQQICDKPSLKVKFNLSDANKRFSGLRRLNLHAMPGDASLLRERLAAELFRRMDVPVSRITHAFVTINGEARGLFSAVEDVDVGFVQDRWQESGNLYKEAWPTDVMASAYNAALRTNKAMPDNKQIAAFAAALFAAKPGEHGAVIDRFTDAPKVLAYLAVDRAINHAEGPTGFFCDRTGGECINGNYFWYQRADGRLVLVPWDLTATFRVRNGWERVSPWDQRPADCGRRGLVEAETVVAMPGCDLVFQGLAGMGRALYDEALDRLLGAFDVASLLRLIDQWAAEIADPVALDPFGPGRVAWRAAVRQLKVEVAVLRQRLEEIRAAVASAPFGLTAPGVNDFETTSRVAFHLAASSDANLRTGHVLELAQREAIGGKADVRLAFDLANETDAGPNSFPWVSARLPFGNGRASLAGSSRIRITIAADGDRSVRLELDSPRHAASDHHRYGAELTVTATPTTLEIPLASLTLPPGAPATAPTLDDVVANTSALLINPHLRGNDDGALPRGHYEPGFVRVDDITFE